MTHEQLEALMRAVGEIVMVGNGHSRDPYVLSAVESLTEHLKRTAFKDAPEKDQPR